MAGLRVVSARSQRSEPAAGDRWLAVGDAAAAHDPLTGLGIYRALESGMAAAEAIARRAGGSPVAFADYAEDARARFEEYLALRTDYYRNECRWPDAPFWWSRHRDPAG